MADKLPWGLKSEGLAPNSMKNITENKLKAFNIGTMNIKKGMTKKEQDEMKKKREQEETEAAYRDFVESFSNVEKGLNKSWVKGGSTHDRDKEKSDKNQKEKLYRPKSKLAELASTFQSNPQSRKDHDEAEKKRLEKLALKKKQQDKKKSNLELFKEELKNIQKERQDRRLVKQQMSSDDVPVSTTPKASRFEPPTEAVATGSSIGIADEMYGKSGYNYDNDMQTTNLYLGNINPKMTEAQLCDVFGRFGPLASVKIMWPRSEEERQRGRNCGFVAYMNRKDGERAMDQLQSKEIMNFELKLGWGKAVPIPPHPVYIPPALAELTLPPPPSGLPFNAQVMKRKQQVSGSSKTYGNVPPPGAAEGPSDSKKSDDVDKTLANAVVKVVIPTERTLLCLIHRTIEFVVREGPMFEAMIMNRELSNPMYRFLFENQSPAHVYYRWKMFSILQGESPYKWRTNDFRMFKGGSLWRPPSLNPYTQGMPEVLVSKKTESKKGQLTESQRDRLEDLLRELTPEKNKIGDGMVWCLEHAEAAEEIVECIAESLSILQTPIPKKIARLFLISDILNNCSAKVPNASFFRKFFESKLPEVFRDLHEAYEKIEARLKAEQFKQKVMTCFRAWEDWAVYTNDLLINLQNIFLGLVAVKPNGEEEPADLDGAPIEDVDGMPIEDVDGMPLEHVKKEKIEKIVPMEDLDGQTLEEVDGTPLPDKPEEMEVTVAKEENDVDGQPLKDDKDQKGFKYEPSKWESVDESLLEAQAVTTSKWDLLEQQDENQPEDLDGEDLDGQPMEDEEESQSYHGDGDSQENTPRGVDSYDGSPYRRVDQFDSQREMTEERRAKLREIEVKVVKYQDEVEAGKRSRKAGLSFAEQVEYYRQKLVAKEEDREREEYRDRMRKEEREKVKEWERARDKERDRRDKEKERDMERLRERDREREYEYEEVRKVRETEHSFRESERYERSPSSEEYTEIPSLRVYVNRSVSRSPARQVRKGRSNSPPSAYREESPGSARKRHRSRSRDRRRHRSRSPRKMSRSGSPRKSKRSKSRSPARHRHKHKKSRH